MTHGSDRGEKGRVHLIFYQQANCLRPCFSNKTFGGRYGSHETEMSSIQTADCSRMLELLETLEGERKVLILPQPRRIKGVAFLTYQQLVQIRVHRKNAEAAVAAPY